MPDVPWRYGELMVRRPKLGQLELGRAESDGGGGQIGLVFSPAAASPSFHERDCEYGFS
jgi:hypothetical protein